ncbi:hypothetical protein [Salinifilum aidingensis]
MSETPRGAGEASPADPDAGAQRHTTPLRRDNSRIAADADGGTGSEAVPAEGSADSADATEVSAPPAGAGAAAVQPAAGTPPAAGADEAEPHTDQFPAVPPAPAQQDQRPGPPQPAAPPAAGPPAAPAQGPPPAVQPAPPAPPPAQQAPGGTALAQQQPVPAIRGNPHPGPPPGAGQNPGTARQAPSSPHRSSSSPRRSSAWTWAVRGLVLLGVALLSGAAWWAFGLGGPSGQERAQDRGEPIEQRTKYQFDMLQKEGWLPGCAQVSTARIAEFFGRDECVHRTRALYTTTLPNGDRVVTTVVTVLMHDEQQAAQLDRLLTRDGTGNIKDLVDEGMETHGDLPGLNDKAYGSQQQGELVVIGDSAYMDGDTPKDDPRLLDVTGEALRLGWPQDRDQG